jgi:coenzyme F420-reducing hydrogenase alpha subunit
MAFTPGSIDIEALVSHRRVVAAQIASTRPTGMSHVFVGRPVDEVPALCNRLFALCGRSHATAAERAIAAALDRPLEAPRRTVGAIGLYAERIAEAVRGTLLGGTSARATNPEADVARIVRDILAAARSLFVPSEDDRTQWPAHAERLANALRRLGLPDEPNGVPDPQSLLGRLLREAEIESCFALRAPDPLTASDDPAVIGAVRVAGETFAAAPALPGRIVETGAYARHWRESAGATALAARLRARLIDLAECRDRLCALVRSAASIECDPVHAADTGPYEGFAALESPRGRLYHWLRATPDGRIAAYAIVAPTEWNFHSRGPFVNALVGTDVGRNEEAGRRVARLAALFDPCVAFNVRVTEAEHA